MFTIWLSLYGVSPKFFWSKFGFMPIWGGEGLAIPTFYPNMWRTINRGMVVTMWYIWSSTILLLQFRGFKFCSIYFGKYHTNHSACAPYVYQDEMNDFIIIWSSKLPCGPLCIWTIWAHRGDLGIVNKQTFLNIHPNKTEWQMLCESTVPLVYFEKIMIWCCGWEGCEI